jgi:hypothetical protein
MKQGDNVKTSLGKGTVKQIKKLEDGRFGILIEIPMKFMFIEGEDIITIIK